MKLSLIQWLVGTQAKQNYKSKSLQGITQCGSVLLTRGGPQTGQKTSKHTSPNFTTRFGSVFAVRKVNSRKNQKKLYISLYYSQSTQCTFDSIKHKIKLYGQVKR